MALAFHAQHGHETETRLFDKYRDANKDLLLGSTLWLKGKTPDQDLALRLLLRSVKEPTPLNEFDRGYAQNALGKIYQEQGKLELAESHYRNAIAAKYEDACNSLGVMWEKKKDFEKARKTYLSCLPELSSPLLLLNLGTLYYNGLGTKADKQTGARYWQQSYEGFAYDVDVNYNLGIYHLRYTHNTDKARYHLALAVALGDTQSIRLIANPAIIGVHADKVFADELRMADEDWRQFEFSDRLTYTLKGTPIGEPQRDGIRFEVTRKGRGAQVTASATSPDEREMIIAAMFWLVYVDRFSFITLNIKEMHQKLERDHHVEFQRHGWQHQATLTDDGRLQYEIFLP